MAKKIGVDTEKQTEIANRFLQIRKDLFGENNREMSNAIGEDERIVSAICNRTRPLGQSTLMKLLLGIPTIDANWLLTGVGSMQKHNNQSVGNISRSTAIGVNVNGSGININGDFVKVMENNFAIMEKFQSQTDKFQQQIDRLINILEKKL